MSCPESWPLSSALSTMGVSVVEPVQAQSESREKREEHATQYPAGGGRQATDVVRTVDPAGAKNLGPLGRRETEGVRQPVER